jgi:adenosylcobinamide-GDP ribazoletransferase
MLRFRAALACFTRLPAGAVPLQAYQQALGRLPFVGLVLGLFVGSIAWLAWLCLPAPLAAVLSCCAWAALTGGLHLDGVADCGDGLFVEASPARRLEIMQDSRLGTFGAVALLAVLGIKTTALAGLFGSLPEAQGMALWLLIQRCLLAAVLARCLVLSMLLLPSARPGGMADSMRHGVRPADKGLALLLLLCVVLLNGMTGLYALLAAGTACALVLRTAYRSIGGITGDVAGCLVEVMECAALAASCLSFARL